METNSVDIIGLTEEGELSSIPRPSLKYFHDRDYIRLSKDEAGIYVINKVEISLSITTQRELLLQEEKLLFLDGEKSVDLSYTSEDGSFNKNKYNLPFSTVLSLEKETVPESIKIFPIHLYPYINDENTVCVDTHYALTVSVKKNFNNEIETIGFINPNNEIETIGIFNPDEESL